MEDVITAVDRPCDRCTVADITFQEGDRPARHRRREILHAGPYQVIQNADLARPLVDQPIDDVRADQPGPPVTRTVAPFNV